MDDRLGELLRSVLDLGPGPVPPDLSRSSLERWDSINHLKLITALEAEYGIEMAMSDVAEIKNVADIERMIEKYHAPE